MIILFIIIFIFAWQSDDAYLAHRTSWNLVNGNGFVFNAGERVGATTSPLFTLVTTFIYFITGDIYWSSMLLCFACSITAIFIMQKRFCITKADLILSTVILILCTSFIQFTTSGLENPMLFLLSAFIIIQFINHDEFDKTQLLSLSFFSSLLMTTRMDNILIVAPLLVYAFFIKSKINKISAVLYGIIGMLPFFIWTIFSTLYYGFPFPNTAYAKLNTAFPLSDYLYRGMRYFIYSAWSDPLLLLVPILYIIYSIIKNNGKHIMISLGIMLYYAYITYIGGDFMIGRHYTVPFFISLFCIFDLMEESFLELIKSKNKIRFNKTLAVSLVVCVCFFGSPYFNMRNMLLKSTGIEDERAYYFPYTSVFGRYAIANDLKMTPEEAMCERVKAPSDIIKDVINSGKKGDIVSNAAGIAVFHNAGYYHFVDTIALADPLLARLPAIHNSNWRIGHMRRSLPLGYRESVQSGENKILNPDLHQYYDILSLITKSNDFFASKRLKAIVGMNFGRYDYLIDNYLTPHLLSSENDINNYLDMLTGSNFTVLLSVKDEATQNLNADLQAKIAQLGIKSNLDGKYRYSFVAVIDNGAVKHEGLSQEALKYEGNLPNGFPYVITSAGMDAGNNSSIIIADVECSLNSRGLNIVVFDNSSNKIIDRVCFDTFSNELTAFRN